MSRDNADGFWHQMVPAFLFVLKLTNLICWIYFITSQFYGHTKIEDYDFILIDSKREKIGTLILLTHDEYAEIKSK